IEVLLGWLKHYSSPKLRTCPFTKPSWTWKWPSTSPSPISAEMEKALNASTCDNFLPPEQRNQVLQLILPKKSPSAPRDSPTVKLVDTIAWSPTLH
ncbi:hypothetical protein HID58_090465, partial [Brassica napus]